MTTASYDEALFRQLLAKRLVRRGPSAANAVASVTYGDIEAVFYVVAWDVIYAIKQQRPDVSEAELSEQVRGLVIPGLAAQLVSEGWRVDG